MECTNFFDKHIEKAYGIFTFVSMQAISTLVCKKHMAKRESKILSSKQTAQAIKALRSASHSEIGINHAQVILTQKADFMRKR